MRRLPKKHIKGLITQMQVAATGGPETWDPWCDGEGGRPVNLCLAAGELLNPQIQGFVWSWRATGKIETGHNIPSHASLVAQGLEGLIKVRTDMNVALMVLSEVTTDRGYIEA